MNIHTKLAILATAIILSSLNAMGASPGTSQSEPSGMIATSDAIKLFQSRVAANPHDYYSWTLLGQLKMRQAREEDHFPGYQRAEEAFLEALKVQPHHAPAQTHLASAYLAQHRFADALQCAQEARASSTGPNPLALATIGDAQLEMGNLDEAAKAFRELAARGSTPPVLARLARVAEMLGETHRAVELIEEADRLARQADESNDQLAWYAWRLAGLYFNSGDLDQAQLRYQAARDAQQDNSRAIVGLATVHAARQEYSAAVDLYLCAISLAPEPMTQVALADVYTMMGDNERAKRYYDEAQMAVDREASDPRSGQARARERAMFLCNRDDQLAEALKLAQDDLVVRRDVYAYDTLAWALLKNGRHALAAEASQRARSRGTRDAALFYHAGVIAERLGNAAQAREFLRKALEINPYFSLIGSGHARELLAQLGS